MGIIKPSFYKQTDSRWARKGWNTTDGGWSSVGPAGCGSTSVANVVNAIIRPITPDVVFKYACKHGYQTGNSGLYRYAIPKMLEHYGVKTIDIVPHNADGKKWLKAYLRKNYWAIAIMGPGIWTRGGHYITAYYVDSNDNVYISDPASSAEYRHKNKYSLFWEQQKDVAWCIVDPKSYKRSGTKDKSGKTKSYTLYTNNAHANIRANRTTNSKLVATLSRNKALKVKSLNNGWWQIASGKYKGKYINESNLSKYRTETIVYKTMYTMNVRDGYTTKADIIGKVEKGRAVKSTKQRGRWAYIPSKKGWICIKDDNTTYLKKV